MQIIVFNTFPLIVKIVAVYVTVIWLYDLTFVSIILATMAIYAVSNYYIEEKRAVYFKDRSKKDSGYN
jgi:ABC-type transport system involved in Fe-S cluster assembly fused permease/ATPase subunit